MEEREIYFKNKLGLNLAGTLISPSKETSKIIVFCHGLSTNKHELGLFDMISKSLLDQNFAVFMFDFTSHGKSQGNYNDLRFKTEKEDISSAINLVKKLGYKKISIISSSFSAGPTLEYLSNSEDANSLILLYPLIDYKVITNKESSWAKTKFSSKRIESLEEKGYLNIGNLIFPFYIPKGLLKDFRTIKPYTYLKKIDIPILFIHGDKDSFVPYLYSLKYSKMNKSKLKLISGAEHGFYRNNKHKMQVTKEIISFLKHVTG